MNNRIEDQMIFPSQMYRDQGAVGQGRQRRRRRRNESESATAGLKKRKLNSEQLSLLEMNFVNEHKLECERKDRLASELGLDPRTVAVWFQNRRARWKSKKMEEEYFSLKKSQESVRLQNSQLESEIRKLKEQLMEAEKEIQRLSSNSPSSSFSIDGIDEAAFVGQFGYEDCFYMQHDNYIIPEMEWVNLYNPSS